MSSSKILLENSFSTYDFETTGLNPNEGEIIEVAAVRVEGGVIVDSWSTLVKPLKPISEEMTAISGITNEMVKADGMELEEALAKLLSFSARSILVEHSFRAFDVFFLEAALGYRHSDIQPIINTCTLSRRLHPEHRSHKLALCCERYGIINDQAHRALSDARAEAELLISLLNFHEFDSLEDLITFAEVKV